MATPPAKVIICHVDPDGDGAGLETISVSERSVQKHLDHGDHTGACFVCNDNHIDPPTETCDDGALNGQPGFCNTTCDGMVPTAVCGNDVKEPGEECDGTDLGGAFCELNGDGFDLEVNSLGNLQGNVKGSIDGLGFLFCNDNCTLNFSECFLQLP